MQRFIQHSKFLEKEHSEELNTWKNVRVETGLRQSTNKSHHRRPQLVPHRHAHIFKMVSSLLGSLQMSRCALQLATSTPGHDTKQVITATLQIVRKAKVYHGLSDTKRLNHFANDHNGKTTLIRTNSETEKAKWPLLGAVCLLNKQDVGVSGQN